MRKNDQNYSGIKSHLQLSDPVPVKVSTLYILFKLLNENHWDLHVLVIGYSNRYLSPSGMSTQGLDTSFQVLFKYWVFFKPFFQSSPPKTLISLSHTHFLYSTLHLLLSIKMSQPPSTKKMLDYLNEINPMSFYTSLDA